MTRKHFRAVAAILDGMRTAQNETTIDSVAGYLADLYAMENPRFDRVRFLVAAGVAVMDD